MTKAKLNLGDDTVPGEFIVRGSWGNIIVDQTTGKVLRINDTNGGDEYADIVRVDPRTLRPRVLSDGSQHNEIDILSTRYFFLNPTTRREVRVDPIKGADAPKED